MKVSARQSVMILTALLVAGLFALGQSARAAHDFGHWDEQSGGGDAGDLPATAQVPEGSGSLSSITGTLSSGTDADMFAVCLLVPEEFSASTQSNGGIAAFDSQLFLFDKDGFGVYFNDDESEELLMLGATLPAEHELGPQEPGIYYLAVSEWEFKPISESGLIFPEGADSWIGIHGPTGPGGSDPVVSWLKVRPTATTFGGVYTIVLSGAAYPSECDADNGDDPGGDNGNESAGVAIDVRPGDESNSINPESNGVIPVAILSSETFDAATVDPASLTFGATGSEDSIHLRGGRHAVPNCGLEDVNGDGLDDLVCHFWTQATSLSAGDTEATLRGATFDGDTFEASDSVEIVGSD